MTEKQFSAIVCSINAQCHGRNALDCSLILGTVFGLMAAGLPEDALVTFYDSFMKATTEALRRALEHGCATMGTADGINAPTEGVH